MCCMELGTGTVEGNNPSTKPQLSGNTYKNETPNIELLRCPHEKLVSYIYVMFFKLCLDKTSIFINISHSQARRSGFELSK